MGIILYSGENLFVRWRFACLTYGPSRSGRAGKRTRPPPFSFLLVRLF